MVLAVVDKLVEADEEAPERVLATVDELVEADEEELEMEEGVAVVVIDEHKGTSQSSHAPPGCL